MEIACEKKGDILFVKLQGDNLDGDQVKTFKDAVIEAAKGQGAGHLVLDLSNLKHIDSAGIGGFLSILRAVDKVELTGVCSSVRTMLEVVRMAEFFPDYESHEEPAEQT